jgi:hypothetical protein
MSTKKRLTNCREITHPDRPGQLGQFGSEDVESPDWHRRCREPLCHHRGATATGYVKSRPVTDQESVRQWADLHDCCQVCGIDEHKARWAQITGLQTHHIIKAGRSDEPCNLLRVCERCHRIIEGECVPDGSGGHRPPLTLAHVLCCKQEHDPREYDLDRLVRRLTARVAGEDADGTSILNSWPRPEPCELERLSVDFWPDTPERRAFRQQVHARGEEIKTRLASRGLVPPIRFLDFAEALAEDHTGQPTLAYNLLPYLPPGPLDLHGGRDPNHADYRHGPLIRPKPPRIVSWYHDDGTCITVEIPR